MNKELKKRLRNPMFLLAAAGLVYQAVQNYIDLDTYKNLVDVLSYALIGMGIYKSFDIKEDE